LISYVNHPDPARVMRNAVLDDIAPLPQGSVVEYWRGPSDFNPEGKRKAVFETAMNLSEKGRVFLYQVHHDEGDYSYMARVL
jgi:hypothetical protein